MPQSLLQPAPKPTEAAMPQVRSESQGVVRRVLWSIAVWLLYVPHLFLVRVLGPRWGMAWVRRVAWLHYALLRLGVPSRAAASLRAVYPHLNSPYSYQELLRRHIAFKHACFVELRLYAIRGWTSPRDSIRWTKRPEETVKFEQLAAQGKGLLIIGYHFGYFRQSVHLAPQIHPGHKYCQVRFGAVQHKNFALAAVARLAAQITQQGEDVAGSTVYYLQPGIPPLDLARKLGNGEIVCIAADGMVSRDFVDVPFLNGKMRMPCGWARLAGITGSPVVVLIATEVGNRCHEMRLWETLSCASRKDEHVHQAVAQATRSLEALVRAMPWAWHPWHRLAIERLPDGSPLYVLAPAAEARDYIRAQRRSDET